MTRLKSSDVANIGSQLEAYEAELIGKTGMTLLQIASLAAGVQEGDLRKALASASAAVIPITAGEGIIERFADAVCSIVRHLGCPAFVTEGTDVTGIAEAIRSGARILFMADDQSFVAINLSSCAVADNAEATGRGYAAALSGMAGGLEGKPALVLGAGRVGRGALAFLKEMGAIPHVYDINPEKAAGAAEETGAALEADLASALRRHRLIIDATPQAAFIGPGDLHPEAMIAAPGIPLGLTPEARAAFKERLIHDPLQIGVAAMLAMASKP
ncbi:MAG: 3-methylornithyl-N6-L-lysine dehydrogenase PylD [Thermacetogeniaceae bacterium]